MTRFINKVSIGIATGLILSCSSYKQNIMFKTPENFQTKEVTEQERNASIDYLIQSNDILSVEVFSNNGEKIIDPNPALTDPTNRQTTQRDKINYLVASNGTLRLPLIGEIKLNGLSLRQAEISVQKEYSKYFKDPYVLIEFVNKRVTLLGATGGQIIPMQNQNMRLTEVLALGKGLDNNAKAQNIRVIRGQEVFVLDFSTIDGYRSGNILIHPGDIIYVEPVRRPFTEAVRENGSIISIIVSLASLVVIILNVK